MVQQRSSPASTSSSCRHDRSALASLFHRRLCATSASLLMPTSVCEPTSSELSRAALLLCDTSQHSAICSIYGFSTLVAALVLSKLDYGNASLPVFRPVYSAVFSLYSLPLLGWLPFFDNLTTSQRRLPVCTGSGLQSEPRLNWL